MADVPLREDGRFTYGGRRWPEEERREQPLDIDQMRALCEAAGEEDEVPRSRIFTGPALASGEPHRLVAP
ncbi:MAG: hypothetical protein M0Z80_03480 [Treponema sp.]|nr:hypothetical protein [Treponema sp.]